MNIEDRVEAGRQANAEYRGDTPPTWLQRLKYGFALLDLDGDDHKAMRCQNEHKESGH